MTKKRSFLIGIFLLLIAIVLDIVVVMHPHSLNGEKINLRISVESSVDLNTQVYYLQKGQTSKMDATEGFLANQRVDALYNKKGRKQVLEYSIPADTIALRFDPADAKCSYKIYSINIFYDDHQISSISLMQDGIIDTKDIEIIPFDDGVGMQATSGDGQAFLRIDSDSIMKSVYEANATSDMAKKILVCVICDAVILLLFVARKSIAEIPQAIMKNKKLIWDLAKNDFRTKFAGSYLGIIWAFVQPIVTVLVYWFVFEKALNVGTQSTKSGIQVPYVLWLIAGLVPWFYFSEVLSSGTNVFYEYSYLVKKVVFNISILPVVKVISSLFVHLFFIAFTLIMYFAYHYWPTLYMLQIFYYSFAMIMLSMGIVYLTSAIMVFFKDLSQIIGVLLQVGVWMTPIMWNIDGMADRIPGWLMTILKMNPMYYIVCGYRDALINDVWFWERPGLTLYYWMFTILMFALGTGVFRRLRVHFADVL